jgi:uncharacterized membrane protein YfcA
MLRGLVFAAAMVVVRLVQGALINAWQTQAGLISVVLLLLFIIAVAVWGLRDGRADARAMADPDRRQDLAMVWLLAGLVAGILSGAVSWLIALFYTGLYTGGLLNEVTTFAAFTALLVFVPGIIGVAIGRWRAHRTRGGRIPTSSPPFARTTPRPARCPRTRRPRPAPRNGPRRLPRSSVTRPPKRSRRPKANALPNRSPRPMMRKPR